MEMEISMGYVKEQKFKTQEMITLSQDFVFQISSCGQPLIHRLIAV